MVFKKRTYSAVFVIILLKVKVISRNKMEKPDWKCKEQFNKQKGWTVDLPSLPTFIGKGYER